MRLVGRANATDSLHGVVYGIVERVCLPRSGTDEFLSYLPQHPPLPEFSEPQTVLLEMDIGMVGREDFQERHLIDTRPGLVLRQPLSHGDEVGTFALRGDLCDSIVDEGILGVVEHFSCQDFRGVVVEVLVGKKNVDDGLLTDRVVDEWLYGHGIWLMGIVKNKR